MWSANESKSAKPAQGQAKPPEPGLAKLTAIEVCRPDGEYAYLDRLRCADGRPALYERLGSVGFRNEPTTPEDEKAVGDQMGNAGPIPAGQKDFHILDAYDVRCTVQKITLYMDLYHCPEATRQRVPSGFTLDTGK
jgi:hypothetical protein